MKLLFISYINRSGSTFLANEFSKYDSILVCPEAEVLVYYFIQQKEPLFSRPEKLHSLLSRIMSGDPKLKYWNLSITDFNGKGHYQNNFEIFLEILKKYRDRVKPKANIILFKADTIAYFCNNIPEEFYEKYGIKIISILRDGRASYASQRETIGARKQKPMNRNPVKAAILWKKWINFFASHKNDPRFIIIRYEELITNFRNRFDHLLAEVSLQDEIGKGKDPGDLYDRIPRNQRPMHENVLKTPLPENINKWMNMLPPSHIIIFEKITRQELIHADYILVDTTANKVWTYILYFYFWVAYHYQSSVVRRWLWSFGKTILIKTKG